VKELIRKIIIINFVNKFLIQPLRYIKFLLPFKYLSRLPVIGEFTYKRKKGKSFKFASNGYDPTANLLFWSKGKDYESHFFNLLNSHFKNAGILFDVGANTGVVSIQLALLPNALNVYAFEPLPRAYNALQNNLKLNEIKNCHTYQLALSDSIRESTLYVPNVEAIPTSSSLRADFCPDHSKIKISITTLDEFVQTKNIKKIDLVKIDVEVGELGVLKGMKSTLEKIKPHIICEILPRTGDLEKTSKFLIRFGYFVYEILENEIKPILKIEDYKRTECIDFLFSPSEMINLSVEK